MFIKHFYEGAFLLFEFIYSSVREVEVAQCAPVELVGCALRTG